MNPLLSSPRNVAINQAFRIVREHIDGWFLIRGKAIPIYDLTIDRLRYDRLNGNWTAYVKPVGNPYTEYKIHFIPDAAKFVMTGTNIQTPIEIPESYV